LPLFHVRRVRTMRHARRFQLSVCLEGSLAGPWPDHYIAEN
jgi:hypothetical protein